MLARFRNCWRFDNAATRQSLTMAGIKQDPQLEKKAQFAEARSRGALETTDLMTRLNKLKACAVDEFP
ncbi:hypothetical protein VTI74DRAFT_10107 [Chaetomium olivicolor]